MTIRIRLRLPYLEKADITIDTENLGPSCYADQWRAWVDDGASAVGRTEEEAVLNLIDTLEDLQS